MTAPAPTAAPSPLPWPAVRVAVRSGVLAAGVSALLVGAGCTLADDAPLLFVDDAWLPEADLLADGPAVVALGSAVWARILPDLALTGWAALPADATAQELLAGVLGAAAGLAVLPPDQVRTAPPAEDDAEDPDLTPSGVILTPREREVLALLAEGLSNKRLARELGVSESTVKFHVQALYSKLGVQSRAGAVSRGIQQGLVSV